jgi:uncharacterized protein YggE
MIHRRILLLALLLVVSTAAADELDPHHATVYGTATLEVAPNQMKWSLNVRNTNPNSTGAAADHTQMVAAVMTFLKESAVPAEKIQTSRMQLGENWNHERGMRVREGYFASTDVSFTLADFDKYAAVWIGLSGLSGVTVQGIDMDHTDRIRFQNEARTKAVRAARDKAQGIAEALGVTLGEPLIVDEDLSVSEDLRTPFPALTNAVSPVGEPASIGESLAPGTIPIKVRVRAVFRLLTP